ncbi:MAG: 30S ribosome-binding factor RbfA [Planctomycetota bacterium]
MSRRRLQLASTIERTVQQVLARGLADPRVKGLITVTSAELNDETRTVYINVSVLPEQYESVTLHGLKAATVHIRKQVMERIRTREMPRLEFRLDKTVKQQAELLTLINKANESSNSDTTTAARDESEAAARDHGLPPANDAPASSESDGRDTDGGPPEPPMPAREQTT